MENNFYRKIVSFIVVGSLLFTSCGTTFKVGIIPIVYSVDKGKISKAGLSTVFGTNEEANSQMKKEGFYQITQSQQTKFDVEYNIFGDKTIFGKDTEKVDQMLKELTNLMNTI